MKYFAYGSNMDKNRMIERKINFTSRKFAKLENYKLIFNKKAKDGNFSYANIEISDGAVVEGIIYEFPDIEISNLDKAEGFPKHYNKVKLVVNDKNNNPVNVVAYIAQLDKIANGLLPTSSYLNHLLAGKDILTSDYFESLLNTKTI